MNGHEMIYKSVIDNHMKELIKDKTVKDSIVGKEVCVRDMPTHFIKREQPCDEEACFIFDHDMIKTKLYHDESCAVFTLLKAIEDFLYEASFVFIRHFPEVSLYMDFEKAKKRYFGYARLSTDKTKREIKA